MTPRHIGSVLSMILFSGSMVACGSSPVTPVDEPGNPTRAATLTLAPDPTFTTIPLPTPAQTQVPTPTLNEVSSNTQQLDAPTPAADAPPTASPTLAPTSTPTPMHTPTPTPTLTPIPTPTPTLTLIPTPTPIPLPHWSSVSTQTEDNGIVLAFYISLSNQDRSPVRTLPRGEATIAITITDLADEEVYSDEFQRTDTELARWTSRLSGQQSGFIIRIPKDEIERSFIGTAGTANVRVSFGLSYFELTTETRGLPEVSQEEKDAAALDRFLANSVQLSGETQESENWSVTPIQAGCFTIYKEYGGPKNGIRIDLAVVSKNDTVRPFYDDVLLRTPSEITVESSFESTILGKSVIPGVKERGFVFFEDLPCDSGEYRLIVSTYRGIYIDETFSLGKEVKP